MSLVSLQPRRRSLRRSFTTLAILALLMPSLFTLAPSTASATTVGTVRVVIERLRALDCVDEADTPFGPICLSDADFYAEVIIDGEPFNTTPIDDNDDISPNWSLAKIVNFDSRAAIPIQIRVWDSDAFTGGGRDEIDIHPNPIRPIDINLEAPNCFVTGDLSGDCFSTLTSSGTANDRAQIWFHVEYDNTPPSIAQIGPQGGLEDRAIGPIGFTVGDSETPPGLLVVSARSSDQELVADNRIRVGGGGPNRNLTIDPNPDKSGTCTIIVRVDDGTLWREISFPVTIDPDNDSPVVSPMADRDTDEDVPITAIEFSVSDLETNAADLLVSGSSSNQALVPNNNIAFGGAGINRTLTITPTHNMAGDTTIEVTASDGSLTGKSSFHLHVNPVNDPPDQLNIPDQRILKRHQNDNRPIDRISFTVNDLDNGLGSWHATAISTDPGLLPSPDIRCDPEGHCTIQLIPIAEQVGSATVTVELTDGVATTSTSFLVEVVEPRGLTSDWLVLLYLAGDDIPTNGVGQESLTGAIKRLLGQLETMLPNSALRLVVLVDGNQPGDSHLLVRNPGEVDFVEELAPTPWPSGFSNELDMGDRATLHDFVAWARAEFPSSPHTMLSIVGHGGGWAADEGSSGQPRGVAMKRAGGLSGLAFDASAGNGVGSSLSTKETRLALDGLGHFDVLFFDACLMGMVESAYEVQPYADYFIAGENILWSQLPYPSYLAPDVLTKDTDGLALARAIVERYNEPAPHDEPFTMAAIDLRKLKAQEGLILAIDTLAKELAKALPGAEDKIRQAYAATQKFDYDASFSIDPTDGYVDLADFAWQLLQPAHAISPAVDSAAQQVFEAVKSTVVVSKTVAGTSRWSQLPWNFAGAHGLSIYLPLGERDCRPTGKPIGDGVPAAVGSCLPPSNPADGMLQIEPQLPYYANPDQLLFSRDIGAPNWAALLQQLDSTTPLRDPKKGFISPGLGQSFLHTLLPMLYR